tara:strand:- start:657 stop:1469 length:813 start_codon:yes stop_codon:yes gene_type:complete
MPYLGSAPTTSSQSLVKQDFSVSATTSYTLSQSVTNANDIALFINNVRQEPTTAYSASGTSLTLTEATAGTDDMYCIYIGRAVGTINPASGSVGTAQITDSSITTAKINDGAITSAKLASGVGGKVLSHKITQITANSTRSSASSYADDLDFGSFTPSSSSSIVLIQGVANFDGGMNTYLYYKWVVDGSDFLSTGGSSPNASHIFYNSTSLNNNAYMPSTLLTSVTNTDGSAIPVKCQGKVTSGTLYINRSYDGAYAGSPSTVIWTEIAT